MSTHQDCQFTNLDLLDVDCAKNITHMDEVYDEIIFDIVDAVSVMPDKENDFKVINFCSNRTVNDSRVYLTLKGTDQDTLPQENSYCQCTISGIKPTSRISVRALDIRLQNYTSHVCGSTEIQMKWEDKSGSIKCHGKSAMFGSKDVLKSKGKVTLTLSSVSADAFPTALWVEAVADDTPQPVTVTCEGFVPITRDPSDDDDDDDGEKNGDENGDDDGDSAGMMGLPVIIGIAVGGVVFIIIVILIVCGIVRHK
nr:hypothetical protein BaRGS_004751 [Batillaria attramentaria]